MGQEAVEGYPTVGDEARALRLAEAREGPRGVDRELSTDHVLADVEGRRVALADEGDPTPGGSAPNRGHARLRIAGAVHRGLDALAVGQLTERRDRIHLARVDDGLGAELPGERQALGGDIDRDHARAHRPSQHRGAEPDRPLAEDGEGVATGDIETLQRAVGGAGPARDRRPRREAERLGKRNQRVRRHAHEGRVAAVARHAVDDDALPAELRPADAAVLAPPASLVVMDHHALADRRVRFADAGPALGDDAARLVAGDDGSAAALPAARYGCRSLPHMPEAFMATTTSPGPGVGSGNSRSSSLRLPRKTTPRIDRKSTRLN